MVARVLAREPLRAIYSSPLSRARETAEAIARAHGLPVRILDALAEVRLGVWEGLTEAEVRARDAARLEARRRDPEHMAPEGGETLLAVRTRALAAVTGITERHPDAAVAVVAHGAINKSILLAAIGAGQQAYWRISQANGAISVLEWDGAGGRVMLLNGTAHLDGLGGPEAPPDPSSIPPRETS